MTSNLLKPFTQGDKMLMLAFDHRGSFKKSLERDSRTVSDEDIISLKRSIIESLHSLTSGILIDQDYGLPAYNSIGIHTPFLLPMEKTGYTDAAGERVTELQYNATSIRSSGAQGAKLFLYTNPHVASWQQQMETARIAIKDAQDKGLPLFLEFVLYEANGVLPGTVVENVTRAIHEGIKPSVWKVPYPGSREACREMTRIANGTPWILLTGGDSFEIFKEHFREACEEGGAGCLAGRALWSEACDLYEDQDRLHTFLDTTLTERMKTLHTLSHHD